MIKMGICNDTEAVCDECGRDWHHTREMYRVKMFGQKHIVCKVCADMIFRKFLRASCLYDGKVKTKVDHERERKEAMTFGKAR